MNSRVSAFILKNKLRLLKGTLRHAWSAVVGLAIVCGIFLYQVLFSLLNVELGTPVGSQNTLYVFAAIIIVNFFRVFFNSTPVFKMNAATLLYTYNSVLFIKTLRRKQIVSIIYGAVAAFLIAFALQGFVISVAVALNTAVLTAYIENCTLMSWVFYHGIRRTKITIVLLFVAATAILFVRMPVRITALFLILAVLELWCWKYVKLNIPKYYERLQILDASTAAQSQNDFARMHQLAVENRPQYAYGVKFQQLHPTKSLAITAKSLIEVMRMQKQLIVMPLLLLVVGWIIYRTDILSFLPFFENPEFTRMLAALCMVIALNTIYLLLTEQIKTVLDKRLLGLPLPFTNVQVIMGYAPIAVLLNLFLTVVIGILFDRLSFTALIFWGIACVVYFVHSFSCQYGRRYKQIMDVAANLILWLGTYWYLIW